MYTDDFMTQETLNETKAPGLPDTNDLAAQQVLKTIVSSSVTHAQSDLKKLVSDFLEYTNCLRLP